jgi:hypothetical protein
MSSSKQGIKNGTSDFCTVPLLPCSTALLLVCLSLPLPNDKRVISLSLRVTECWPSHRTAFQIHTATPLERCSPCIYHEEGITTRTAQKAGKQTQMVFCLILRLCFSIYFMRSLLLLQNTAQSDSLSDWSVFCNSSSVRNRGVSRVCSPTLDLPLLTCFHKFLSNLQLSRTHPGHPLFSLSLTVPPLMPLHLRY